MDQLKKQKEMEEFKQSVDNMTLQELKELEQTIISEAEQLNKDVQESTFKLGVTGYKEAAEAIRHFLDDQSVSWQYTVGMITMYDFWNPKKNPGTVSYPMLDGTLRTLGELKFKGYDEWKMVVAINEFFTVPRDEYAALTEKLWDNASKHNVIMDRMKLLEPLANEIPDKVQVMSEDGPVTE